MSELTNIYANKHVEKMRRMALASLGKIEWRHHGIGVLQGYLLEDYEPEIRLHVWHPKLLKPGMDVSGDTHDHRFDMVSHVLCGMVIHEEVEPILDPEGDHRMLALTHARAAADTNYHGPTREVPGKYKVVRQRLTIDEGNSYSYPAQHFHRSPLRDEVAVTVVEKYNQCPEQARLLFHKDHPPVMAFGHEPDQALISHVLQLARAALQGLY